MTNKKVFIGISGKPGVGKNMLASYILRFLLNEQPGGIGYLSFARPLKETVAPFLGLEPEELDDLEVKNRIHPKSNKTYRQILTDLFYSFEENIGLDFPVEYLEKKIRQFNSNKFWICSDVRQPYQAEFILNKGGYLFRLDKDDSWPEDEVDKKEIESMLDNYPLFTKRLNIDSKFTLASYNLKQITEFLKGKI